MYRHEFKSRISLPSVLDGMVDMLVLETSAVKAWRFDSSRAHIEPSPSGRRSRLVGEAVTRRLANPLLAGSIPARVSMSHAETCPVCKGSGKYKKNKCHGCSGLGWVTVGVDYPSFPPISPSPPDPNIQPAPYTPWNPLNPPYIVTCQHCSVDKK